MPDESAALTAALVFAMWVFAVLFFVATLLWARSHREVLARVTARPRARPGPDTVGVRSGRR
jgi:hypothetical protein